MVQGRHQGTEPLPAEGKGCPGPPNLHDFPEAVNPTRGHPALSPFPFSQRGKRLSKGQRRHMASEGKAFPLQPGALLPGLGSAPAWLQACEQVTALCKWVFLTCGVGLLAGSAP